MRTVDRRWSWALTSPGVYEKDLEGLPDVRQSHAEAVSQMSYRDNDATAEANALEVA